MRGKVVVDVLDPVQCLYRLSGGERRFSPASCGNIGTAVVLRIVWMDPAAVDVDRAVKLSLLDTVEGMCRLPALREFFLRNGVDISGQLRGKTPLVEGLVLESMPVARRAADEEDRRGSDQVAAHPLILSHRVGRIDG